MVLRALITTTSIGLLFVASAQAAEFTLSSPTIAPGGSLKMEQVYQGFGCEGQNISPELKWSGAPKTTKTFALTVYDPDAPTGSGWWHWVVYDLPASATGLAKGAGNPDGHGLPKAAKQGPSDFGTRGFGGACPPKGDKPHRYIFTVYALKTEKLAVPENATAAMIGFSINANKLGSATFTAKYGR